MTETLHWVMLVPANPQTGRWSWNYETTSTSSRFAPLKAVCLLQILTFDRVILSILGLNVFRVLQYVLFCICLLSLKYYALWATVIHSFSYWRIIHWLHYNLCIYVSIDRHLGCSKLEIFISIVAMYILIHVFWWTCICTSVDLYIGAELLHQKGM